MSLPRFVFVMIVYIGIVNNVFDHFGLNSISCFATHGCDEMNCSLNFLFFGEKKKKKVFELKRGKRKNIINF